MTLAAAAHGLFRCWRLARHGWLVGPLALLLASTGHAETLGEHVTPDAASMSTLVKVKIPPPPAWPENPKTAQWTVDDFKAEFERVTDRTPSFNYCETAFVRPDHDWLVTFMNWFVKLQRALRLEFRNEVWDCDNYARCFVAFADVLALKAGESRGSICVGWATVRSVNPFGGISGSSTGAHALVVVGTSKGIFVIEPQSGKMAALSEYPNRDEFVDVYL